MNPENLPDDIDLTEIDCAVGTERSSGRKRMLDESGLGGIVDEVSEGKESKALADEGSAAVALVPKKDGTATAVSSARFGSHRG